MPIGFRRTATATVGGVRREIGAGIARNTTIARKDLDAAGHAARRRARATCPVDTGRLRNSIRYYRQPRTAVIATSVPYARFQEYGFRHYLSGKFIPGKHYMEKGYQAGIRELRKRGYRRGGRVG